MRLFFRTLPLLLAACGDADTSDPDFAAPPNPPPPAGAEMDAEASVPLSGVACLPGTWAVDAARSFRPEVWANLVPNQSEVAFEYGGSSGRALLTFEAGGAALQRFEDFEITLTADSPVGEMSTAVGFDGTAAAGYTVEGDALRFTPGDATLDSRAVVSMGGREVSNTSTDFESLFETGERSRMTFTCVGDELLLDVHESPEGGRVLFEDSRYVRVARLAVSDQGAP